MMKKRVLAILITLTMVLTYMPAIAFADAAAEGETPKEVEKVTEGTENTEETLEQEDTDKSLEEKQGVVNANSVEDGTDQDPDQGEEEPSSDDEEPEVTEMHFKANHNYEGYIGTGQPVDWFGFEGEEIILTFSDGNTVKYIYDEEEDSSYYFKIDPKIDESEIKEDYPRSLNPFFSFVDESQNKFKEGKNEVRVTLPEYEAASEEIITFTGVPVPHRITSIEYKRKSSEPLEAYVGARGAYDINSEFPEVGDVLTVNYDDGVKTVFTAKEKGEEQADFYDDKGNKLNTITDDWYLVFGEGQSAYKKGKNTIYFQMSDDVSYYASDDEDESNFIVKCPITVTGVESDIESISFSTDRKITLEKEEYVDKRFDEYEAFADGDVLTVKYKNVSAPKKYVYTYYEDEDYYVFENKDDPDDDTGIYPDYYDDQSDTNYWGAGAHSYFVTLEGRSCEVKNVITVVETPHQHDMEHYEEYIPPCGTDETGYKEHFECNNCNKYFADEEGTKLLSEKDVEILAKDKHSYGKWEIIEAASDYSNGWRKRSCTVCGDTQESDVKHIVTLVPEVKATCGKPGTKAYYKCSECDQIFSDKDYIDLITEPEEIPATGKHQFDDWKTVKEPTTTAKGLKERTCKVCGQKESADIPAKEVPTNLKVKNLWASQHSVGKVLFKWSQKDGVTATGWNLKYRFRKIGGNNSWSGWTEKAYPADTYEAWIPIKTDYVIEIHAQAKGDSTWSTGIITCPAGGKYHAMKETHVVNAVNGKRLAEKKVGSSAVLHTDITLKVGETLKVKPSYNYDPNIKDFKARPRLYPSHLLYDIGDKSMITIYNVGKGNAEYKGGIIDGAAVIKATKAGKTTIVFRSPNGRTLIGDVTITK